MSNGLPSSRRVVTRVIAEQTRVTLAQQSVGRGRIDQESTSADQPIRHGVMSAPHQVEQRLTKRKRQ
ncbi:hypothetical protein ETD86_26355 [Nonomuraea turkmeniaca]|uniref:Uncharacterized protein n=1 Tax=Nonomuraea turkmeniaca TaxID=103838 RepID=A0A5S4FCB9_9ACTN|nr:hypothetical protein [Nonomuraea turkmeniaca]TMR15790.1 hypothetical protein ETD86_26355 [Nonomuraea turkmeniaca]